MIFQLVDDWIEISHCLCCSRSRSSRAICVAQLFDVAGVANGDLGLRGARLAKASSLRAAAARSRGGARLGVEQLAAGLGRALERLRGVAFRLRHALQRIVTHEVVSRRNS